MSLGMKMNNGDHDVTCRSSRSGAKTYRAVLRDIRNGYLDIGMCRVVVLSRKDVQTVVINTVTLATHLCVLIKVVYEVREGTADA